MQDGMTSTHQGLIRLLDEVREDILSQVGRVGPDFETFEGLSLTVLAGGIIDDRKYLVSLPVFGLWKDMLTRASDRKNNSSSCLVAK